MSNSKPGRNKPCHCGSEIKYKFCHYAIDATEPELPEKNIFNMNSEGLGFLNTLMHFSRQADIPLHEWCAENGLYYFKHITIAQWESVAEAFAKESSSALEVLFLAWEKTNDAEYLNRALENNSTISPLLRKREKIISQIITNHFNEMYETAIPSSFMVIEGLFREYNNISFETNQGVNYKIDLERYQNTLLYADMSATSYFTKFLNKIMTGKPGEASIHRNSVMHGVDNSYATKRNSLLLLLAIFEFARLETSLKVWPPKSEIRGGKAFLNGYEIKLRENF
ncbi:SEC-C domain-containing protein [Pseudomonas viridiflava]|uniref:SEC-C domain-containing protein n=1 Tax=Pseudomonas viridiflava TaxID=33069 RepID=UPI002EBFFF56|nr:SEC-C domain-containing protein [Pseudomonas viridiflava]